MENWKKVQEMIAIGFRSSSTANRAWVAYQRSFAVWSIGKQIIEAIEVGIEMGGGPATVSARFAMKVWSIIDKIP